MINDLNSNNYKYNKLNFEEDNEEEDNELIILTIIDNMKITWHSVNMIDINNNIQNLYKYYEKYYKIFNMEILYNEKNLYLYKNLDEIIKKNPNRLCLKIFL